MEALDRVAVIPGKGLDGDRFKGRETSKRQVTLIQKEHLHAIASCLQREAIGPEVFRRNIVVSGLNLLALKGKTFRIGSVVLEYTGLCHPCSKMETTLGPGGYNAMRGHGGITTRVVEEGELALGDDVQACL
ncbi:MOSC domain-containing protein [Marinobacter sp. F4206]|nr:MOSC domain-containing protein [Marinobacter sp. F4206]MBW4934153.1 MOSC domain-containing protein [Marinobacter sp. F4206]